MECPKCKINVELTWTRYFKSPFSRFVCPECSAKFKFQRTFKWYAWALAWMLFYYAALFFSIFIYNKGEILWKFIVISIIMFAIYIPIDRKIESTLPTKSREKR